MSNPAWKGGIFMLWRTHVLGGTAAGYLAATGHPEAIVAAMIAGGLTALIPDIDSPYSKLGRVLFPVSYLIKHITGHRGAFHSLAAALGIALVLSFFLPFSSQLLQFKIIFYGMVSHLLLDALTPGGVPLLYPLSRRFSVPLVRTGGILEKIAVTPACFLLNIWLIMH
jgi:inner membrane protein